VKKNVAGVYTQKQLILISVNVNGNVECGKKGLWKNARTALPTFKAGWRCQ
jgi:hypothetical protein